MNKKKMVLMDIDGVMADLEGRLVEHLVSGYGKYAEINRDMYSLEDRYVDFPEIRDAALSFVIDPNSYYPLPPLMDGLEFTEILIAKGYPVQFLSSRPQGAQSFTARWLRNHLLDYDHTTLGVKCLGTSKVKTILKDYKDLVEFVVDDKPSTVEQLNEGGILAYSWAQIWNVGTYPAILHDNGDFQIATSPEARLTDFWEKWS